MLPSDSTAGLTLQVVAAEPTTEIFVVNADLELVARGFGTVTTPLLRPGIYRVKSRIGAETREQFVAMVESKKVVTLPPFDFASASLLTNTAKTHEYQTSAAFSESRRTHVTRGAGSGIFIFARDWMGNAPPVSSSEIAATGLSLLDRDGQMLVDFNSEPSVVNTQQLDRCSACNIAVNAGLYRLAVDLPNGSRVEQTVVACPGWQTQVFLLRRDVTGPQLEPGARRPDLTSASILMAREGTGFTPDDAKARQIDVARLSLTSERAIATDELQRLLRDKFDNPMLGIFGGHLLLLDVKTNRPPDIPLLQQVVWNLRALVGGVFHPDVEALALASGLVTAYQFVLPPMLRRSWAQVVTHTIENPALVPQGSVSSDAASHVLQDNPWFVWASRGADGTARARAERNIAAVLRSVVTQTPIAPPSNPLPAAFAAVEKLRTQETLRGAQKSLERASQARPPQSELSKIGNLVRTFGLPRANVESMLTSTSFDEEDGNGNS